MLEMMASKGTSNEDEEEEEDGEKNGVGGGTGEGPFVAVTLAGKEGSEELCSCDC
jgi:hypothetical protein